MSQPFFSVVLPVYNVEAYLAECIESVLTQTFTDWELVIIDDVSTDQTPKIIRSYMEKNNKIQMIQNDQNIKSGPSTNHGIEKSAGRWICRLDGDDKYHPEFLERFFWHIQPHQHRDDCFFTSRVRIIDSDGKNIIDVELPGAKKVERLVWMENVICQSATSYPRALWEKVGGYPMSQSEPDDRALWKKFLKAGAGLHVIPEVLVDYRIHFKNTTFSVDSGKAISDISGAEASIKNKEWKVPIFLRQGMLQEARKDIREIFALKKSKPTKFLIYYFLTFLPSGLVRFLMWEIRPRIIAFVRRSR